jgi:hypothetical protein
MAALRRLAMAASLLLVAGCDRPPRVHQTSPEPETYVADPGSLGFDLERVQENREFIATYTAHEKMARFRIQLDPPNSSAKKFVVGKGRFLREPRSDAAAILSDLAIVLEAKNVPKQTRRASSIPFEYVILGDNMSKGKNGFGVSPGHWSLLKLFFGNDDAELFLNLNPVIRKGEFSIKDPDYGDYLMAQLAQIL